ncbi:uncharacterized protein LOC127261049 [Andrographis paniculata]|uniref:uncharacterized protein LOC127261049 n=1 Tax=Andrographis paniculata TaxID=175694 RepID=UPI0021E7652C|nr:uncharacterized protein LOC127261049 [Andrographis paniculata]
MARKKIENSWLDPILSWLCFLGSSVHIIILLSRSSSPFCAISVVLAVRIEPSMLLSWLLLVPSFFLTRSILAMPSSIIPLTGPCRNRCGNIPIKFPFGSGFGCGHPDFSRYVKCGSGAALQLSTGSGTYTISSIDYAAATLVIADPLMSTCSSMQNSGSFILDGGSPFGVADDNIFVLVGCSTTSPVFDRNADFCDRGSGMKVCRGLYSCKGVAGIGLEPYAPTSTCCVYEPPAIGYGIDLPKLQCSSYSAVYGFGGSEGDPMKWQYGISLQYNNSNYYTSACKNCEDSGGICGFSAMDGNEDDHYSFSCKCPNGTNSTINCYGRGYAWSWGRRLNIPTAVIVAVVVVSWMGSSF